MASLHDPLRFWIATCWVAVLAGFGGASRADEPATVLVRLLAVVVGTISLWKLKRSRLDSIRPLALFACAIIALGLLHLLPLPPGLWAALPGHGFYDEVGRNAGLAPRWRPLSLSPDLTIDALLALLPSLATLFVVAAMPQRDRPALILPIVAIAVVSAVVALAQTSGIAITPYRVHAVNEPIGGFANRNHYAVFLACALVLLGAALPRLAIWKSSVRATTILGAMIALFLLMSVIVAGSRMGLIAGVLGFAGGAYLYIARLTTRTPRRGERPVRLARIVPAALALLAIGAAFGLAVATKRASSVDRLVATGQHDEQRVQRIGTLWEAATTYFPTGSGLGTYVPVYQRFEPDAELTPTYSNQAHNEPIQVMIETGLPGLALVLVFAIWWYRRSASVWRSRGTGAPEIASGRAGSMIVALALVSSLTDYPLRTPMFASLFVIACIWMKSPDARRLS